MILQNIMINVKQTTNYQLINELKARNYFLIALIVSALIHILIFSQIISKTVSFEKYKVINVSLENLFPEKKDTQMVSPSDISNEKPPEKPAYESDTDNAVETQSIKKGDTPDAGKAINKNSTPAKAAEKAPQKIITPETIPDKNTPGLKPVSETQKTTPQTTNPAQSAIENNLAAALGTAGVQDMINGVKEGELTLLNTKASKHAVFVRRIATQVFNELKSQAWKRIGLSEIKTIRKFNEFIVKLDKSGKLISVTPSDNSGSINFDNILRDALKLRANDPHPVESALAPDGTYTFIFQSSITGQIYGGSRNNAPTERRYLIMRVGLE